MSEVQAKSVERRKEESHAPEKCCGVQIWRSRYVRRLARTPASRFQVGEGTANFGDLDSVRGPGPESQSVLGTRPRLLSNDRISLSQPSWDLWPAGLGRELQQRTSGSRSLMADVGYWTRTDWLGGGSWFHWTHYLKQTDKRLWASWKSHPQVAKRLHVSCCRKRDGREVALEISCLTYTLRDLTLMVDGGVLDQRRGSQFGYHR